MDARDPVRVSAVRTPIGAFGGGLRDVLNVDLATTEVTDEVCKRSAFPKEESMECSIGCGDG